MYTEGNFFRLPTVTDTKKQFWKKKLFLINKSNVASTLKKAACIFSWDCKTYQSTAIKQLQSAEQQLMKTI